jgi:TRAP transporter TAXI family solute receptor
MKRIILHFLLIVGFLFLVVNTCNAQAKLGWPKGVTIGTSGTGGVYFVWGGGFAKLLHDKMGITGNVEVTGGPVHNIQLTEVKQLDFGLATAGPIYEGWHGLGWAKGRKHQNLRVIFPMYASYAHAYALKKSGIKSIYDLNGKSVGVGAVGTTPAVYWPPLFELFGIKTGRIVNAGWSDLNSQMKDGMLDAVATISGLPWGLITELETIHEVNVFGVPKAEAEKFIAKYPFFSPGIIPKGLYKGNKEHDIETISIWNFMIVHRDAPDDFIYEVVKKTFDNLDVLIAVHSSAKEMKHEFIVYSPIPLHPGAVKYYREKGVKIPDKLIFP